MNSRLSRNCCESKNTSSIDHDRLRHACDGVVGRECFELFPLCDDARSIFEPRFPRAFRRVVVYKKRRPFRIDRFSLFFILSLRNDVVTVKQNKRSYLVRHIWCQRSILPAHLRFIGAYVKLVQPGGRIGDWPSALAGSLNDRASFCARENLR
jgi:hypothetical protein